jgi:hypothetical protein
MKVVGANAQWAPSFSTTKKKPSVFVRNMQAVLMVATSVQHINVLRKNNMKKHPNSRRCDLATLILVGTAEFLLLFLLLFGIFW